MKLFILIFFVLLITIINLNAQQPPCMPTHTGLTFQVSKLLYAPPLSLSMPLDVLIGYIMLDSICRNSYYDDVKSFIERQTYNDTIRYIMRYLYKTIDFNPIKFFQYNHFVDATYKIDSKTVFDWIAQKIKKVSPMPYLDYVLFNSNIIARIHVSDTLTRINPGSIIKKNLSIVTCEILDTIKGKQLPHCKNFDLTQPIMPMYDQNNFPENCLEFTYSTDWIRNGDDNLTLLDTNGLPWIKKDKDYIVFLNLITICSDSNNIYYSLRPVSSESKVFLMFPIENGIVLDIGNDFGFGTGLTFADFILLIRQRINQIITYSGN